MSHLRPFLGNAELMRAPGASETEHGKGSKEDFQGKTQASYG